MTPTDPTPPPADVRDVIAATLTDEADEMDWDPYRDADQIIAALTEAGYVIAPKQAGMVTLTTHLDYGVMVLPDCPCGGDLQLIGPHEARCKTCGLVYAITVTMTAAAPDTSEEEG